LPSGRRCWLIALSCRSRVVAVHKPWMQGTNKSMTITDLANNRTWVPHAHRAAARSSKRDRNFDGTTAGSQPPSSRTYGGPLGRRKFGGFLVPAALAAVLRFCGKLPWGYVLPPPARPRPAVAGRRGGSYTASTDLPSTCVSLADR
jgi:hypothetical protein